MEKLVIAIIMITLYIGMAIAYPIVVIPATLIVVFLALSSTDSTQDELRLQREEKDRALKLLYIIESVDYKEYIKSAAWHQKRLARLKKDKYTCQKCGDTESLEVHHLTYAHLGDEPMEDLICLCRACHQKVHDKYGKKGNYFPID